jgi:hypothetical protein
MLGAHHEFMTNGLLTVAMGILQPEFRFNGFVSAFFFVCAVIGTVSNGIALAYSAYLSGGRIEVGPLMNSQDMHLPFHPVANAILMYACAPFVLLALFTAAIGVFRARGRRFTSRLVISIGFLLVAGSCMLHMVVPPHGAVLYRYLVGGHVSGTWGGVLLVAWGLALESVHMGGILGSLLALSSVALTVGHTAAFIYLALKGLFLHAAKTVNIQSADFSVHSKELINALQAPVGWIDTVLPFPQVFYAVCGVGLLVAAPPLAYGVGAGFLSRRQGRFRLQGFALLLLACLLYVSPELFENRRYLSYLHAVLVSSSATAFLFAELKAQGLVGGLFELLAAVSLWIYPALLAFGAYTGTRSSFFSRMNTESSRIEEVHAKMTGTTVPGAKPNQQYVDIADQLYLASAITASLAYLLATLLALRAPAVSSAHAVSSKKKN